MLGVGSLVARAVFFSQGPLRWSTGASSGISYSPNSGAPVLGVGPPSGFGYPPDLGAPVLDVGPLMVFVILLIEVPHSWV